MTERLQKLAGLFKALSDPNRLGILELIRARCGSGCRVSESESGNTVSEIAERFDLALSTVSHHLKELRRAGLICCTRRGQWIYCTPNDDELSRIEAYLKKGAVHEQDE